MLMKLSNQYCSRVRTNSVWVKFYCSVSKKYPLRGYIQGVLSHTSAWDRLPEGDDLPLDVLMNKIA